MKSCIKVTGKQREGYIFLITILFIGIMAATVLSAYLLLSITALQSSRSVELSTQALSNAYACADRALQSLQDDFTYAGNISVSLTNGTCKIYSLGGVGIKNRSVCTEGVVENVKRKFEIMVKDLLPNITISSWKEVGTITACAL